MANNNVFIQLLFLIITSSGLLFHETVKVGSCQGDHQRGCIEPEKVALLEFKQGLTDPSRRFSSWVGEDCCKWRGVVCSNRSGHVIKLTLRYLDGDGTEGKLGGKISPALLELKYLNYLDLSMNNFGGIPIPEFIGLLEKLRYLNLSGASFGGPIPPQLGNLSSLRYLDLKEYFNESNQNDLHWLSGLSSLRHLNLGGVDLSQDAAYWLQAVSKLPSLSELHLPACALADLPPSLPFSNLITSLSVIDLSHNGFNSTIPHWLFQMRNLVYLDLSSNNLRGSILEAFANGTSWLETLDLGFNDLGGFLPNSLGKLYNLKFLWLWDNSFVGSIPSSIGNLSYLEELYLSDNAMNGTIPEALGRLSKLVAIEISENPLTGVVTEAHFSNLTSLKEFSNYRVTPRVSLVFNISPEWIPPFKLSLLRIRSCQMGPKFPAWLRNQTELTDVVLNNAGISHTIPEWFWKLDFRLDELDIGSNNLGGRVPNSMKFLPGSTVDLSENNFQGPLPLWSSNVMKLYLYDNFFSGPIPLEFGDRMPMLTDLDLSSNALNGTIPLSFGKLNNLLTLVISNNHLSGGIPEFWNGLPYLYAIDMNNNNLSGELPSSMGSLRFLRFLMISNNHLSGQLPSALQNCTGIHTLDLGGNRFSGNVPAWIGERMPNLLILRLRSNLFHGSIPSQLCTLLLSTYWILDKIICRDSFPSCVGNLSGMA
ncbi:putative leucine-rich repeat receptor-like protein kinase [Vitis vinifera]|uniref:Putative leucine-rich repeat receptor-like protein kinase n=1 Tax=Vitis vinifera TaxID=29760 RepID=A0A438EBQ6_VITVI|nr:putative leucine-rich repeat receptor-like protein kinase [Vitis vinifera]